MTEIEEAKKILNKGVQKIEVYKRLEQNPDFAIFRQELIDDKVEALMDILTDCKPEEVNRVMGQLEALRGIVKIFDFTIKRQNEVKEKLKELK